MDGKNALSWIEVAGALLAGYAVYKLASAASSAAKTGASVAAAVADEVKTIVTKDLNPVSPENVVYKATNVVTGGDNSSSSVGTRIYDYFHPAAKTSASLNAPPVAAPVDQSSAETARLGKYRSTASTGNDIMSGVSYDQLGNVIG